MLKIAITGNIASGKSTVEKFIEELGYKVFDTDKIAHEILENSEDIRNLFGTLDRTEIAKIVFNDNEKLKLVFVLLDSRIEPTELDKQMLDYLAENEIPAVIIMTKTDKLSRSEVFQNMSKISKEIRFNKDLIIATSALKKQGVDRVETLLDEYLK